MSRPALAAVEPLTVGAAAPVLAATASGLALVGAMLVAVVDGTASWPAEVVALCVLAAAGAALVVGSGSFLAPFSGRAHVVVVVLLALFIALDDAAHAGGRPALEDGSALVVVPLLLLVLAVLRPPAEVLASGTLLAGASVVGTALIDPGGTLLPARAAAAAVVVLGPAVAVAALAHTALGRLAAEPPTATAPEPGVRLSVQQETVARLEAEAIPLLAGVLAAGAVTEADGARATGIAVRLRAALLTDLGRGWLADLGVRVDDRDGYIDRMTAAQRTALRTLVAAVEPSGGAAGRVVGQDHAAQLVLDLPSGSPPARRRLAPSAAMLRTAFDTASLRIDAAGVRVTVAWEVRR